MRGGRVGGERVEERGEDERRQGGGGEGGRDGIWDARGGG